MLPLAAASSLVTALALQIGLPPRAPDAPGGAAVAARVAPLSLAEREEVVVAEVLAGNVPASWREFVTVDVSGVVGGRTRHVALRVAPDYVTVGSDEDGLRMPLSPASAQRLADGLGCALPTPRLVDLVHAAAGTKLTPAPIPPDPAMTTVAWFERHDTTVDAQLRDALRVRAGTGAGAADLAALAAPVPAELGRDARATARAGGEGVGCRRHRR